MNYKKQTTLFFATVLSFFLLIELAYQFFPIPTTVTVLRKIQISQLDRTDAQYAMFGSSVSHEILGNNPYVYENVFNGTTVGATTLYGQYFLFDALFGKTTNLKSVYFSFVPRMLGFDPLSQNKKRVVRFFNEAFKEEKYVGILKALDPDYEVETNYYINRRIYLDKLLKNKISLRLLHYSRSDVELSNSQILNNKETPACSSTPVKIQRAIDGDTLLLKGMTLNPAYYSLITALKTFKHNNPDVNIVFVLEPVPLSKYSEFVKGSAYKEFKLAIESSGLGYFDSNKQFEFKNCHFKDQLHLRDESRSIYRKIMATHLFK